MDKSYPAATSGSRSKLISGNFKKIFSGPGVTHPQKNFTAQLYNAERQVDKTSSSETKPSEEAVDAKVSNATEECSNSRDEQR